MAPAFNATPHLEHQFLANTVTLFPCSAGILPALPFLKGSHDDAILVVGLSFALSGTGTPACALLLNRNPPDLGSQPCIAPMVAKESLVARDFNRDTTKDCKAKGLQPLKCARKPLKTAFCCNPVAAVAAPISVISPQPLAPSLITQLSLTHPVNFYCGNY